VRRANAEGFPELSVLVIFLDHPSFSGACVADGLDYLRVCGVAIFAQGQEGRKSYGRDGIVEQTVAQFPCTAFSDGITQIFV
jgi:hypothetical protein